MAFKISLTLLNRLNHRSKRSATFCCEYNGFNHSRTQLFVSSTTAGVPTTRESQLTAGIGRRMPANRTLTTTKPIIDICVAQDHDHDRLLNFLRTHYYPEEPLTAGSEPKQQEDADEEFNMSNVKHGTCLIAVHRNNGEDNIVGAVIAGPKDRHELEHLIKEAAEYGPQSKWGRILEILACIERDANVFERFGIERAIHAHALGVHQCVRGLALGARLMKELMALGQKRNFQLLTADCTSVYSARLCERLGMECVNVLRYEDYCDKEGNQVFQPSPPHDAVITYAMRLCN